MLQIWLLYDFYFLMCAYIVAKMYVPTYGLMSAGEFMFCSVGNTILWTSCK